MITKKMFLCNSMHMALGKLWARFHTLTYASRQCHYHRVDDTFIQCQKLCARARVIVAEWMFVYIYNCVLLECGYASVACLITMSATTVLINYCVGKLEAGANYAVVGFLMQKRVSISFPFSHCLTLCSSSFLSLIYSCLDKVALL